MLFWIRINIQYRVYTLKVERIYADETKEKFKVSGKNKYIVLETDRLFYRNKGLKHRKPSWGLIEGVGYNTSVLQKITDAVQMALE